jgi:hypothetical protein
LQQLGAHVREVVDLAVEDGADGAGLVVERLIAGGQIDDAEAPMAEPDARGEVIAGGVGAAMRDRVGHGLEHAARHRSQGIEIEPAGNTAHGI